MIVEVIIGVIIFLWSILLHELGHLKQLRRHYPEANVKLKNFTFEVGEEWMYDSLTHKERRKIYLDGILWGLLPLLGFTIISFWFGIIFIALYLYGSMSDLKNMRMK